MRGSQLVELALLVVAQEAAQGIEQRHARQLRASRDAAEKRLDPGELGRQRLAPEIRPSAEITTTQCTDEFGPCEKVPGLIVPGQRIEPERPQAIKHGRRAGVARWVV